MRHEHECGQAKAGIHQSSVFAEGRPKEPRVEREHYTATGTDSDLVTFSMCYNLARRRHQLTHQKTVQIFQRRVTDECIVYRRYAGTPHEQDYTTEVKSIAETCGGCRKIPYDMATVGNSQPASSWGVRLHAPRRTSETYCHSKEVQDEKNSVDRLRVVDLFVNRAIKVNREPGKQNGTDDVRMDVDF